MSVQPPTWPALTNPHQNTPTTHFTKELVRRQSAKGRLAKDWWRTRRHLYEFRRAIQLFIAGLYAELAHAPKKTFFDIITALPIGLLVIPAYRDWVFRQPYSLVLYPLIIGARVLYGASRRGALKKLVRDEAGAALQKLMPVIECTRIHVAAAARGERLPSDQLQRNLATVLSALVDLTKQANQTSTNVRLAANLMVPMEVMIQGTGKPRNGCGIVVYNAMPASPSWTRLALGDFGAGKVFESGKVQCLEDAGDPVWCGLFSDSRSQSFASFPVRAHDGSVIAVVNIDADRRMTFTRKSSETLFIDVLSVPLKLLGDMLVAASR